MALEASLLAWAQTFGDAESLAALGDGSVLLCVAQDTMEDTGEVTQDLSGLLLALERAYEVRPSALLPHLSSPCPLSSLSRSHTQNTYHATHLRARRIPCHCPIAHGRSAAGQTWTCTLLLQAGRTWCA